jgi:hypothetical protein
VRAFPSSIFLDKNTCDIGKSQSTWAAKDGNAWHTCAPSAAPSTLASGDAPIASALDLDISTSAAAPSLSLEALAAVMVLRRSQPTQARQAGIATSAHLDSS